MPGSLEVKDKVMEVEDKVVEVEDKVVEVEDKVVEVKDAEDGVLITPHITATLTAAPATLPTLLQRATTPENNMMSELPLKTSAEVALVGVMIKCDKKG